MQFAVLIAVEKIHPKSNHHPDKEPKPICPSQARHQVRAAHDAQDWNEREAFPDAEHDHHERKGQEYEIRHLLEEDASRRHILSRSEIKQSCIKLRSEVIH